MRRPRTFDSRARGTARSTGERTWHHWPVLVWLCLLWMLLWGSAAVGVVLSGLLVAAAVILCFPLPAVAPRAALRLPALVRLVGHLLVDLLGAAVTVAWEAVFHGPRARSGIVEVPLRVDSDLLITGTAHLTTMTPGTLVLEIDRIHRLLYVHALPVRTAAEAAHRQREVRAVEQRVGRAFGTTRALRELGVTPRRKRR